MAFLAAGATMGLSSCGAVAASSASGAKERIDVCLLELDEDALSVFNAALAKKCFAAQGLEIEERFLDDSRRALDIVNAGDAKICFSSQDALAPMFARNEPASIEAIAAYAQPTQGKQGYQHLVVANDLFVVKHFDTARKFLTALCSACDGDDTWGCIDARLWNERNAYLYESGAIDRPIYTHHGFNLDCLPLPPEED